MSFDDGLGKLSYECAGQELNLHSQWRVVYSHLGSPMPSRRSS